MKRIKSFTARVSEEEYKYLYDISKTKGISINSIFRQLIDDKITNKNILNTDEKIKMSINKILENTDKILTVIVK